MRSLAVFLFSLVLPQAFAEQPAKPELPTAERWLQHISQEIAPYYMQQTALGEPLGAFPTYRCNDGSLVDPQAPCAELSGDWLKGKLERRYTRMLSRQIYTYGVIFHMTGDRKALEYAKLGVDYLRANLLDPQTGAAISYLDAAGKPGLKPSQRTTQDLAYAQLGMAFYYYLTRDPAVLADIQNLKDYIFRSYKGEPAEQLRWVLEDSDDNKAAQLELVGQLDQINAYMLLMLPTLQGKQHQQWAGDLAWLSDTLLNHYHDADEQRFYGYIHHPSGKLTTSRHGDWGHTIKAYWMLYLSGLELNNSSLVELAEKGMHSVLERAFAEYALYELTSEDIGIDPNTLIGLWDATPDSTGSSWWQTAELDQAAQTLALKDPNMERYLSATYSTWLQGFVDQQHGGILARPQAYGGPKVHHWKNGYHGAEHALIAYLGASQREQQPATLYFAIPEAPSAEQLRPYYFRAKQVSIASKDGIQAVKFSQIY